MKLPKNVLADLAKSGLDAADAEKLGIEYSENVAINFKASHAGYTIPYRELDGKLMELHRARFLGPRDKLPRDKKGKPQRYDQPPGYAARLYYPPLGGVNWKNVAGDPRIAIYFTEGEKKAAKLCKHGVPSIGLGGVWNWFCQGHAIDDFDDFAWKGRVVKIIFDSDIRHKSSVKLALQRLADNLIKRGAIPYEVELPSLPGSKTGVDDFLVHHGGAKALTRFRALTEHSLLVPVGLTFAELDALKIPPPRWAIEGLLPAGLVILAGRPKSGKSWLMLDVCLAVASGGKALGLYDAKRGGAVYLALEDTRARFQDRQRRVLDGAPAPGAATFFREWRKVEDHGLEALRVWLDQHPDTKVVVIDTLTKMRPRSGGKDDLYRVDYEAIETLKKIADDYAISVVVVHHTRKATAENVIDLVSGSTGLTGAADTILILRRETKTEGTLFITGRDVGEQELALEFDLRTMRWKSRGDAETHRVGKERKEILDALARCTKAAATPIDIANLTGKTRRTVNKLMLTMANEGQLERLEGGEYKLVVKRNEKM